MSINLLKEVLAIPTYSGHETKMIEFLCDYAKKRNITYTLDSYGNIYMYKGILKDDEHYPCVVAHTDTVHRSHIELINSNQKLEIVEAEADEDNTILIAMNPVTCKQTGIGGDDKAGVYICLELLEKHDKIMAAFFVSEENGCNGSKNAHQMMMSKVGYAIQFDAPTADWVSRTCMGIKLHTDEFFDDIKDILVEHGQTKFSHDPFTDVWMLAQNFDFNTINFFAGYENMHTPWEYIIVEHVNKAIDMGSDVINKLGRKKYPYTGVKENTLFDRE